MLTLAIETSNPSGDESAGVAIGIVTSERCEVLAVEHLSAKARHDDDLIPAIDRAAKSAGVAPRDFRRVAVSVGPGGFTSLRIACATAVMIARVNNARCVGVPSALVAALGVDARTASRPFGVALASKADSAFVTRFEPGFESRAPTPDGRITLAPQLAALSVAVIVADSHLPEAMRAAADRAGIAIVQTRLSPHACLRACALCPEIEPSALTPFYAREPEAVRLWKSRGVKL